MESLSGLQDCYWEMNTICRLKNYPIIFIKEKEYHKRVRFNDAIFQKWIQHTALCFHFENIPVHEQEIKQTDYSLFENYEEAYHKLMIELLKLQVQSAKRTIGNTFIKKIYVDGGFADNKPIYKNIGQSFSYVRNLYNPVAAWFCIGRCNRLFLQKKQEVIFYTNITL